MVNDASCYNGVMEKRREALRAASLAAARARTLAKQRRWAQEMREAGWTVEEPTRGPGVR